MANDKSKLIEVANEVLKWWEEAKYKTTGEYGNYIVFDEDDDVLFDNLQKAVKETTDEN